MRKCILFFCSLLALLILMGFNLRAPKVKVPENLRINGPLEVIYPQKNLIFSATLVAPPFLGSSYIGFKEALAFKESQGDYSKTNSLGYLGKYQFGVGTLHLVGVSSTTNFLNDPELQEKAFYTNTSRNMWILRKDIERFAGKWIDGVEITESGLMAAAHLAGPGNVKKYLRSWGQMDVTDLYGTTISMYIRNFSGYDLSHVSPMRNPKV